MNTPDLFEPQTDAERIGHRLAEHGVELEWHRIGKDTVRAKIIEGALETVICWRGKNRKPQTYQEAFEETFGEPLQPTVPKRKRL